jgi:hypothetical protein
MTYFERTTLTLLCMIATLLVTRYELGNDSDYLKGVLAKLNREYS